LSGRDRAARIVLGVVVGLFVVGAVWLDLPGWSNRQFWNDAATYYSMALSLVEDGDLRYEARDLQRVREVYPGGPQGLFLKRTSGALTLDEKAGFPWIRRVRPNEKRLYFAKPFVYPLAAAPFVALLGPAHGLLLTNALALGLALVLGYRELRRQAGPLSALFLALVLFLGTVTPVYVLWLTPEVFNLGLVTAGLVPGAGDGRSSRPCSSGWRPTRSRRTSSWRCPSAWSRSSTGSRPRRAGCAPSPAAWPPALAAPRSWLASSWGCSS
jgi:hypothetical protein